MQKTKIEWCDYSWNPVKGLCPQACWYCYARRMYQRYKWNPEVRLDKKELNSRMPSKSSRIFVASTIDLFHNDIPKEWIRLILVKAEVFPEHTFVFLTKNPARYTEFDFPKNCWLGVTVTNQKDMWRLWALRNISKRNLIFVSFEPLLDRILCIPNRPDWIIVGAMTGAHAKKHKPMNAWLAELKAKAQDEGIPLFEKNNLEAVWGKNLIQEYPERRKA